MVEAIATVTRHVRLLSPWTSWACLGVLAVVVALLWWTRTRHLPPLRQAAVPAAALAVTAVAWLIVEVIWHPVAEGAGIAVWAWTGGVVLVACQILLGGDPAAGGDSATGRGPAAGAGPAMGADPAAAQERARARHPRLARMAGSGTGLAAALAAALLAINAFFGAYPSLAAVLGLGVPTTPLDSLPAAAPLPRAPERGAGPLLADWTAPSDLPAEGAVVTATVPAGDQSGTRGFKPRQAFLYLPPAYLTAQRPALPVLVLMAGQPGSPRDWFEIGRLKETMDAYAAAHGGLAPVVVVVDPLGSPYRNPLCSDTPRGGRAATYLQQDVPTWITTHLQVDPDRSHWAIAGLSNGGTCALQVVTRAPETYRVFLAMSPEEHPTLGGEQRTIDRGFGGDRAAYEANDPLSLMAAAPPGRYDGIAGLISIGAQDEEYASAVPALVNGARGAGIEVDTRQYEGGHGWAVWSAALADEVDWLGEQLGLV